MQLTNGIKLNISPVKVAEIPGEAKLIEAGTELVKKSDGWKHTKDFGKDPKVRYLSGGKDADDEQPWHCRDSEHDPLNISFEEFWFALGTNKPEHEKKFVHDIDSIKQLKELSPTAQIWSLHYHFKPPVSDRIFTVLQVFHLNKAEKSGLIVSIPVDVSSDEDIAKKEAEFKGEKGRYIAVESISMLESGKIRWRMMTSSTPGGSIPSFLAQMSIPGQVANDVPLFLKWFNSDREYVKNGADSLFSSAETDPTPTQATTEPQAPLAT